MDKKLTMIQGGNTPNEMKEAVRQLKSVMPDMIEHLILMAELTKVKYDALVQQGFTEAQALELSKSPLNN